MERLSVEAYHGHKGELTPRAFTHEGVRHEVARILDRWYRQEMVYFRLSTEDEHRYVVRHDEESQRWELVMREEQKPEGGRPFDKAQGKREAGGGRSKKR